MSSSVKHENPFQYSFKNTRKFREKNKTLYHIFENLNALVTRAFGRDWMASSGGALCGITGSGGGAGMSDRLDSSVSVWSVTAGLGSSVCPKGGAGVFVGTCSDFPLSAMFTIMAKILFNKFGKEVGL